MRAKLRVSNDWDRNVRGGMTDPLMKLGKIEKIAGVDCYVATPDVDYPKDKVALFLTDAFGVSFINNQASRQPLRPCS